MNQMKREEDRMSPVLLSVITDDPLHIDLTFRLVYAQTRRRSEGWERESVCSRRRLAQTTGTDRSGKPPDRNWHYFSQRKSKTRQVITFINKWATAGPNLCGGRNDTEVVPANNNIRK